MWLSGLSGPSVNQRVVLSIPRYPAQAWVAGQVSSRGRVRVNHTLMFLSLPLSLPLSLKINKIFKKITHLILMTALQGKVVSFSLAALFNRLNLCVIKCTYGPCTMQQFLLNL